MERVETYQQTIQQQLDFFIEKGEQVDKAAAKWKPTEDEWSVQEVLAHVEEFPLYFTKELIYVVKENQVEWGRGFDHPERLAAVEEALQRSLEDIIEGIKDTKQTVTERLQEIEGSDLEKVVPHRNPKFGEKPMRFLVDHFLVEHLETHQKQVERVLRKYNESN